MANKPANIGNAMANNIPVQYLIDQLKEFKSDLKEDISSRFDQLDEKIDKVEERLTGNEGVTERLTTLEVQMRQVAVNSASLSTYPPAPKKKKSALKDHAPALGAGVGSAGLLYTVLELAKAYLSTK